MLDCPDKPDGKHRRIETNPSRYLLYMDVLGGMFEKHTEPCYPDYYARYTKQLADAAQRSRHHGYMYDMLSKLCAVLEVKSRVGVDAQVAYKTGNRAALEQIANRTLPELVERLDVFNLTVENRWMIEYKASGYDVLDNRLGGVRNRIITAMRRINQYLSGEIDRIEELEDTRLAFNGLPDEELEKDRVMCWGITRHLFTPNVY